MWSAVGSNALLGQQAHEVGRGVGVQSQRRHCDVGSRMGPVLVVVVQACECGMCVGGLSQHHFPWKESGKHHEVVGHHIALLTANRKRLAPVCSGPETGQRGTWIPRLKA